MGWAPGRFTLAGEHVDYARGATLCAATDLGVEVAVRWSRDSVFRVASAGRVVQRLEPGPARDIGDRIFAAARCLEGRKAAPRPVEVGVAADLPESAGLASSAAVVCATLVALLRLHQRRVPVAEFVDLALHAERDLVGVPCGPLDQRALVESRAGSVVLLDFDSGARTVLRWPWTDLVIVGCDSGEQHDVGGAEYRSRRDDCDRVLSTLGVDSCQRIDPGALQAAGLGERLSKRARHLVSETARARSAAEAVRAGDAAALGELMLAGHVSLANEFDAGTPRGDAMVEAAMRVPGVYGARMVGAGFGGTVIALCSVASEDRCAGALADAGRRQRGAARRLGLGGGLAELAPHVILPS